MTAPAITQNTTSVQEAPAPDLTRDPAAAMEATIANTLKQSAANDPVTERPRDATGKFVVQAGETDPTIVPGTDPAIIDAGAEGEGEELAVEIPEGYVAPPALPDDKAVGFKVRDAEGELVPPNLTWEFPAGGKQRTVDTAGLIHYAQMGVYNHELQQSNEQAQQSLQQFQQQQQQFQETVTQQRQTIERLLSDPDYLVRSLQQYEHQNTPEARAQRTQQELEQQRQQWQQQQHAQQAETFVNTELAPALDQIATVLSTVSREELASKLFLASQRYRGPDGILRTEGFQPLQQYILNDLVPWAQQLHAHRDSERQAPQAAADKVTQQAKTDIEKAQLRAQKAKRLLTQTMKPGGRSMPDSTPKQPVRTMKDAEAAVIGNTLAAMRAG